MAIDVVGSKFNSATGYGDTSALTPSSIRKGEKIDRSKIAQSIVASDPVTAGAGDWQTRNVSAAPAVPTNPGTKGASVGERVPASTQRRAIARHMAGQGKH
jgi:hypothetical protein